MKDTLKGIVELFYWLAFIVLLIISAIGIYHEFNPPDIITKNGYVYELQQDPAISFVKYNCTYVLKEGATE